MPRAIPIELAADADAAVALRAATTPCRERDLLTSVEREGRDELLARPLRLARNRLRRPGV